MSIIYSASVLIFDTFFKSISIIPIEDFLDALTTSAVINNSLNLMCCSIILFGSYQCARMAKGNEWVNAAIAYAISIGCSFVSGWNMCPEEMNIWIPISLCFAAAGTYLAISRNKLDQSTEKS
jgi:hypothetical protein